MPEPWPPTAGCWSLRIFKAWAASRPTPPWWLTEPYNPGAACVPIRRPELLPTRPKSGPDPGSSTVCPRPRSRPSLSSWLSGGLLARVTTYPRGTAAVEAGHEDPQYAHRPGLGPERRLSNRYAGREYQSGVFDLVGRQLLPIKGADCRSRFQLLDVRADERPAHARHCAAPINFGLQEAESSDRYWGCSRSGGLLSSRVADPAPSSPCPSSI